MAGKVAIFVHKKKAAFLVSLTNLPIFISPNLPLLRNSNSVMASQEVPTAVGNSKALLIMAIHGSQKAQLLQQRKQVQMLSLI